MTATDSCGRVLPTGTVTFLFSDIQGSTRLLQELGGDGYAELLAEHRRVLRAAFTAHNGVEIGTEGDSFYVAFAQASDAVAAATEGQHGLDGVPVQVRMGLHAGEPLLTDEGYVGMVVHRVARIAAVGHGGQVLLSQVVAMLVEEHLPLDVTLRDLGSFRLKDLASPERIYQVVHPQLQDDFPPLRSLDASPNNLPQQLTSFIGRKKAIADIEVLLGRARLLTISGSGGSGKTRLSLQVAADALDQFDDGAWFVELASLADPSLVAQTVASVLGVKEQPGKPITQTLAEHLRTKQLLLVLDNCEHLLDTCVMLANTLLRQCPGVKILASSREPFDIAGEQIYRVPSLSLPDRAETQTSQSLSVYESVQLFIDRACSVLPDFHVDNQNARAVASLCNHLDGIPLAIELAAARVRSLTVEEIEGKLDQRFRLLTGGSRTALPRQQTLRSLIDWSYDLLHVAEKLLLQRLSVFAGGWSLAAADRICADDGMEQWGVLDLLTSLADKSLAVVEQRDGHSRYRLLETVRQYALDKLLESGGEAAVRERHCDYFLALAEEAEPKLEGPEQAEWLQRLEGEHENLRVGLDWSFARPELGRGIRFCVSLKRFWVTRGYLAEGQEWCARLLGKKGVVARTRERAKVLSVAGVLAYYQNDHRVARAHVEESLAIVRELGDQSGIALSLNNLGNVASAQHDYPSARALHSECLAIMRQLGDRLGIAGSLGNLGSVNRALGDHSAARALYDESLAMMRDLGNGFGIANLLWNLGDLAFAHGDYPTARNLLEESLAIRRQLGFRSGTASTLASLGELAYERGDFALARALYGESLAIMRELADRTGITYLLSGLAAPVVAALGDSLRAARIWGAAELLRDKIGSRLSRDEQLRYDERVAATRAALGDDTAFNHAWQEGRGLTLEQAITLVSEETFGQS